MPYQTRKSRKAKLSERLRAGDRGEGPMSVQVVGNEVKTLLRSAWMSESRAVGQR